MAEHGACAQAVGAVLGVDELAELVHGLLRVLARLLHHLARRALLLRQVELVVKLKTTSKGKTVSTVGNWLQFHDRYAVAVT